MYHKEIIDTTKDKQVVNKLCMCYRYTYIISGVILSIYVYIVLLTTLHFTYRYIINGSVIHIYVIDNMFLEYIILSEYVCVIDISMYVIDK